MKKSVVLMMMAASATATLSSWGIKLIKGPKLDGQQQLKPAQLSQETYQNGSK